MQHKVILTVLDKKVYPELQRAFLADPESGECPFYKVGQTFTFERYNGRDDFWTMGKGTQCSEAWDCISRYIYTGLQGGSIMNGWTADERVMIACCNDGTRPVIFHIERRDYYAVHLVEEDLDAIHPEIAKHLSNIKGVEESKIHKDGFIEVYVAKDVTEESIREAVEKAGVRIDRID